MPPAGSMRRSAATAICSPIWCGGCWRTAPIRRSYRSPPIRTCRSRKSCGGRKAGSPTPRQARNRKIPLPRDLYRPERRSSAGIEFGDRASLDALLREVRDGAAASADRELRRWSMASRCPASSAPSIRRSTADQSARCARPTTPSCAPRSRPPRPALRPGRRRRSRSAPRRSNAPPTGSKLNRGRLLALLQNEAGKTLDDALAELREAVDYCRYYAAQARIALAPQPMPGPTGESNELALSRPRRVRLHQPVEFSARDFSRPGRRRARCRQYRRRQARRADAARRRAWRSRCLHEAGVPQSALHLVPGDGAVGASLVADPRIAGVVFTGSTEVGRSINRALAAKDRPDRAADRRDRRHQCHDRRCHRAARTGQRRRDRVGIPLRRPALLGAAAALPAGRRRRAACSTC